MNMRDDERLIRGLGFYVHDAAPTGALHVAFVRSDHAHAQVLGIDTSPALALPGVVAVWQASDVQSVPTPGVNPLWPLLNDVAMPLLAGTTVEHVGQPVAMVLAHDASTAQAAADLVSVSLQALQAWGDADPNSPVVARFEHHFGGDSRVGVAQVGVELKVPRLLAMAMEPRACVAQWQASNNGSRYGWAAKPRRAPNRIWPVPWVCPCNRCT